EGAADRLGTRFVLGRNSPDFNLRVRLDLVGENLETRTGEVLGDSLNFNRVTKVGLIRTVLADRSVIGNARPTLGDALAICKLVENVGDDRLDCVPDVFLGDEAHFQVELVKLARKAIGTRIFVAETGCNLEVAIKAGDHEQLLVLLRGLRKSE